MTGSEIITLLSNNVSAVTGTLMGAVGSVAGALLTAIFLRHNTATTEFEKIKAAKFKEVLDDLLASEKMTYTELYKANNFLIVAKKADELYSANHSSNDQTNVNYDFDWFMRFYEAVGNISDETMQMLWAKILAGEISQPGSYSLKTIDVLRNISKKDAELFVKVCSLSFMVNPENIFLPTNKKYLEKYNIHYIDIMTLSEYGLILHTGTIGLDVNVIADPKILFTNKELIMKISSANAKETTVRISQYPFTVTGMELAALIGDSALDEYFIDYGRCLAETNKNCKIGVYKVIDWNEGFAKHDPKNLIEEEK